MSDNGSNGSTAKETVKVNQNRANTFSARYRAITNKVRKKTGSLYMHEHIGWICIKDFQRRH